MFVCCFGDMIWFKWFLVFAGFLVVCFGVDWVGDFDGGFGVSLCFYLCIFISFWFSYIFLLLL